MLYIGIQAQETMLGVFAVKGKEKLVCACKDFTTGTKRLFDFCSIKNTVLDSDSNGSGTELSDIMDTIKNTTADGKLLVLSTLIENDVPYEESDNEVKATFKGNVALTIKFDSQNRITGIEGNLN